MNNLNTTRRTLFRNSLCGAVATIGFPMHSQAAAADEISVVQIVDVSASQQDVSKDFLIGARTYWQDLNSRGGIGGRPVRHVSLETDGTSAQLQAAVSEAINDKRCVALMGTAGDSAALEIVKQLAQTNTPLAHIAPWLQNSSVPIDDRTFPIFAGRQEQLSHALRSLIGQGIGQVGAIYATPEDVRIYRGDLERISKDLGIQPRVFGPVPDLTSLGKRFTADTPAILLFMGGTPELIAFMQGLDAQQRQRYLVGLADVNLQTIAQLGQLSRTPVIATQVVPALSSPAPVVRRFRTVLNRLFEEVPTSLSLAGFIASQYTHEVLAQTSTQLTRSSVLAKLQRRETADVGGFLVSYGGDKRGGRYVTQSMLTVDGRIIS